MTNTKCRKGLGGCNRGYCLARKKNQTFWGGKNGGGPWHGPKEFRKKKKTTGISQGKSTEDSRLKNCQSDVRGQREPVEREKVFGGRNPRKPWQPF